MDVATILIVLVLLTGLGALGFGVWWVYQDAQETKRELQHTRGLVQGSRTRGDMTDAFLREGTNGKGWSRLTAKTVNADNAVIAGDLKFNKWSLQPSNAGLVLINKNAKGAWDPSTSAVLNADGTFDAKNLRTRGNLSFSNSNWSVQPQKDSLLVGTRDGKGIQVDKNGKVTVNAFSVKNQASITGNLAMEGDNSWIGKTVNNVASDQYALRLDANAIRVVTSTKNKNATVNLSLSKGANQFDDILTVNNNREVRINGASGKLCLNTTCVDEGTLKRILAKP